MQINFDLKSYLLLEPIESYGMSKTVVSQSYGVLR